GGGAAPSGRGRAAGHAHTGRAPDPGGGGARTGTAGRRVRRELHLGAPARGTRRGRGREGPAGEWRPGTRGGLARPRGSAAGNRRDGYRERAFPGRSGPAPNGGV